MDSSYWVRRGDHGADSEEQPPWPPFGGGPDSLYKRRVTAPPPGPPPRSSLSAEVLDYFNMTRANPRALLTPDSEPFAPSQTADGAAKPGYHSPSSGSGSPDEHPAGNGGANGGLDLLSSSAGSGDSVDCGSGGRFTSVKSRYNPDNVRSALNRRFCGRSKIYEDGCYEEVPPIASDENVGPMALAKNNHILAGERSMMNNTNENNGLPKSSDERLLDLTNKTDYTIVQRNGQRIYGGPPPGWSGPAPERGCEIFVGKVPRDVYEDELVPIFQRAGTIYELRLMMDFSGSNRGYFFVRYTKREEARAAVKMLNNFEIKPNKFLGVIQSVDNRKLWISGIPKNRTAEDIKVEMSRLTDGVRAVILYPSQMDKTKTRGYAFVEYETHRAAALARRKLVPGRIHLLGQEIEKVDWAEPENEVDEDIMSKVKVLFVRNLMYCTTEEQIRAKFEELAANDEEEEDFETDYTGSVDRVKKTKDYAFVHFVSRAAAQRALDATHTEELYMDGALIHVTWSKPVDKQMYQTRKNLTKFLSNGGVVGVNNIDERSGYGGGNGRGFLTGANAVMPMYNSPLNQLNPFANHAQPVHNHAHVPAPPPPAYRGHSPFGLPVPPHMNAHAPFQGQNFRGILPTLTTIAPRKRGAAGIRGLGAPGTAPPRRLLRMTSALSGSTSNGSSGMMTAQNSGGVGAHNVHQQNLGHFGPIGAGYPMYASQMLAPQAPFSPTGYFPHMHQGFMNGGGNQAMSNSNGSGSSPVENVSPTPHSAEVDPNLINAMYNLNM